jgi:hypothetical protein
MTAPTASAAPTAKRIAITLALLFCAGCALALAAPIEYMEHIVWGSRGRHRDQVDHDSEID